MKLKKIVAVLLVLCMLLAVGATSASAELTSTKKNAPSGLIVTFNFDATKGYSPNFTCRASYTVSYPSGAGVTMDRSQASITIRSATSESTGTVSGSGGVTSSASRTSPYGSSASKNATGVITSYSSYQGNTTATLNSNFT